MNLYTEWAAFNTEGHRGKVDWSTNHGVELYNHTSDPGENFNINVTDSGNEGVEKLSAALSTMLRAGPDYGPSA